MKKIKKVFKTRFMLLTLIITFLWNPMYAFSNSKNTLRIPMGKKDMYEDLAQLSNVFSEKAVAETLTNPNVKEFIIFAMKTIYITFGISKQTIEGIIDILYSNPGASPKEIARRINTYIQSTDFDTKYKDYLSQSTIAGRLGLIKDFIEGPLVGDIGCGNGDLTKAIKEHVEGVIQIVATDTEDRNINGEGITFKRQIDKNKIPIDPDSLNTVIASYMLHHVEEDVLDNLVPEMYRILKINGKVVILEDTYSDNLDPQVESELIKRFLTLNDKSRKRVLCLNDWLVNSAFRGLGMNLPFNFKSIDEWETRFERHGFKLTYKSFIGIPDKSFHFGTRGILVFEKVAKHDIEFSLPISASRDGI